MLQSLLLLLLSMWMMIILISCATCCCRTALLPWFPFHFKLQMCISPQWHLNCSAAADRAAATLLPRCCLPQIAACHCAEVAATAAAAITRATTMIINAFYWFINRCLLAGERISLWALSHKFPKRLKQISLSLSLSLSRFSRHLTPFVFQFPANSFLLLPWQVQSGKRFWPAALCSSHFKCWPTPTTQNENAKNSHTHIHNGQENKKGLLPRVA